MNIAPHVARGGCCIRIRKVGRYLACRCTNGYKATSDITRTGAIQERDQMRSTCTEFSVRTWTATDCSGREEGRGGSSMCREPLWACGLGGFGGGFRGAAATVRYRVTSGPEG